MNGYSEDVLVDKLSRLSATQHSIQTLSGWILYHRKKVEQSVEIWEKELLKVTEGERKMCFLYLANDIMQSSRKKGGEFIKEFSKIIKGSVLHTIFGEDNGIFKSVIKLLDVWEDRKVFPTSFILDIKTSMADQLSSKDKQESTNNTNNVGTNNSSSNVVAPLLNNENSLLENIRNLDKNEVTTELMSDKYVSMLIKLLPSDPNDPNDSCNLINLLSKVNNYSEMEKLMEEVDLAQNLSLKFKRHLEEDINNRNNIIGLLSDYIEKQESLITKNTSKLQECEKTMNSIKELESSVKELSRKYPQHETNNSKHSTNTEYEGNEESIKRLRRDSNEIRGTTYFTTSTNSNYLHQFQQSSGEAMELGDQM